MPIGKLRNMLAPAFDQCVEPLDKAVGATLLGLGCIATRDGSAAAPARPVA